MAEVIIHGIAYTIKPKNLAETCPERKDGNRCGHIERLDDQGKQKPFVRGLCCEDCTDGPVCDGLCPNG